MNQVYRNHFRLGRLCFYRQWDLYRDRVASERRAEIRCHYPTMTDERGAWMEGWNKGVAEVDCPMLKRAA